MAETCLPMPGTTLGDAGPYPVGGPTKLGWWDKAYLMNRAGGRISQAALADIGVYYSVDDQLECTEAADTISVDVDTGASLVDGILHYNDTDPVNVPIPAAGAGDDRIDLVVVRKNYSTITTYTPGGGAPAVEPRETRITVIRGVEAVGPAAPTVTQDTTRATYWDIPLCTVQVDDAGALTSLTDLREYVDAETRVRLLPFMRTSYTGAVETFLGFTLPDAASETVYSHWKVPEDYISGLTAYPVISPTADPVANIRVRFRAYQAECGQAYDTNDDDSGNTTYSLTVAAGEWECMTSMQQSLASATTDDFVLFLLTRLGADGLDTYNQAVGALGVEVSYLGWR